MSKRNNLYQRQPYRKPQQQYEKRNYFQKQERVIINQDKSILNDPILFDNPAPKKIIRIFNKKQPDNQYKNEDFKQNNEKVQIYNNTNKQVEHNHFKKNDDDRSPDSDSSSNEISKESNSIQDNDDSEISNYQNNKKNDQKADYDKDEENVLKKKENRTRFDEDEREEANGNVDDDEQDQENSEEENEEDEYEDEEDGELEGNQQQDNNQSKKEEDDQQEYEEQSDENDQSEGRTDDMDDDNQDDYYDQDDYDDDEEIEDRVKPPVRQPRLAESSKRMLAFEMRRINPSLPKEFFQKTLKDESIRRIPEQFNNQQQNQTNELRLIQQKDQLRAKLIARKEELQQKNNFQQQQQYQQYQSQNEFDANSWKIPQFSQNSKSMIYNAEAKTLQYQCGIKWRKFQFIDEMCTPQNIQDAIKLKMFDSTFEVDENYELNTSLIVKQYIRPNQGKQETIFRSDVGMILSIQRLHMIFCDRQKRKKNGQLVSIVEIFQYISDRFRALSTELRQIESENRSSISNNQVKQFSCQIVRIYLLSYLEMMQADQSCPLIQQNKYNCNKYLIDALDDLAIDYKILFNEINESRFYLLDNLPEFIQYYHIMLSQKILSTNSIQKLANLDNIIFSEFKYFEKLIKTSEYQFCQLVKEYIIQKNYRALLDLGQNSKITLFQQFFIYLFQDKIEQYLEKLKQQKIFQNEKPNLNFIDINSIYSRWVQVEDKFQFINSKGNFSNIIFGQEQIENINYLCDQKSNQQEIQQKMIKNQSQQIDQQTKKMKSSIQEILLQICQKQVLNKFTKFLAPHLDKIDQQLGNFYKMQRILKHWRLSTLTEKRYKQFLQLCRQKNNQNIKKQIKIIEQTTFRIDLSRKLINQNQKQKNLYYKIVILNNDEIHQQLVQKLIFTLCDQQLTIQDDSIIIESNVTYQKNEYKLYMSIQILQNLEKERICGADIFIVIGDILKVNMVKPCLQIVFDQKQIKENQETLKFDYEYIALFDKLYESYEFNNKLNQIVDRSLKNKQAIEDLKLISLGDYLKEIKRTECQDYQKDQIEYFITRCVQAELCLEDALNNNIYSDDLPQELLFDRYIDQELILKYVAKFNPANRLMIPICNQLQKNMISERVLLNLIKDYLDEYLDEEELLTLLSKNFKFEINCQGDWKLLFEFIMEQLVQYLENSDIYFVLKGSYNTVLDQNKLKIRIQQDIHQLLKKNLNEQPKSQIRSKIFKFGDLIQKKVCK